MCQRQQRLHSGLVTATTLARPIHPFFTTGTVGNTRKEYWMKRGARVAQSVKHLTLDFGSSHDLTVHELEPGIRLCAVGAEPAWDFLSPSLYQIGRAHV